MLVHFTVFYEAVLDIGWKNHQRFPTWRRQGNRTKNSYLQLLENIPHKRTLHQSCASLMAVRAATLKPSICLCPSGAASVIHLDSAAQSEALHRYQGQPAWRLQPIERWVFWLKYLLHPVLVGKNPLQLPYIVLWLLTWEENFMLEE